VSNILSTAIGLFHYWWSTVVAAVSAILIWISDLHSLPFIQLQLLQLLRQLASTVVAFDLWSALIAVILVCPRFSGRYFIYDVCTPLQHQ
jgi:hypothetical protein